MKQVAEFIGVKVTDDQLQCSFKLAENDKVMMTPFLAIIYVEYVYRNSALCVISVITTSFIYTFSYKK